MALEGAFCGVGSGAVKLFMTSCGALRLFVGSYGAQKLF